MDNIRILIPAHEVDEKIRGMAEKISNDYKGREIHMVCVLKGSAFFAMQLAREIDHDVPVTFDFMSVSSYGNNTVSSGVVKINKDLDDPIEGKDVLIVEDIIDTGYTLAYLLPLLEAREPASMKLCALIDKPSRRRTKTVPDYRGFEIEDLFVVGCGMDYCQKYRNLPFVGVLEKDPGDDADKKTPARKKIKRCPD